MVDIEFKAPEAPLVAERAAAVERLDFWKRGFTDGFRGNAKADKHPSYTMGYRAGVRVYAQENNDEGTAPVRARRKRS